MMEKSLVDVLVASLVGEKVDSSAVAMVVEMAAW